MSGATRPYWPAMASLGCQLAIKYRKSYTAYWLGTEDSNPDLLIQSQLSYH